VWAVGKDLRPIARQANGFLREHKLQDKFVLMFSGNLELGGDMDTLLGALAELRDDRDIVFVLISEGPRLERFREMSAQASLRNVLFLPYQDRNRLAYSLSAGDVHIVTNKRGLGGLRVPCKTYGVLAVGRPILYIGEPNCEIADLVRDHELGFVIRERDVQALVQAIRELRDNPTRCQEILVRARALFETDYQAEPNIDRWNTILTAIAAPTAAAARKRGHSTFSSRLGGVPAGPTNGEKVECPFFPAPVRRLRP
jgi:colanic acid biosynthesis glycosyl transferase WcaI